MQSRAAASQATSRKNPYGLSFSIEDLLLIREWVESSGTTMSVVLDQVVDGAEFEELVVISSARTARRLLTLWRSGAAIHAQVPHARPRAFACVGQALDWVRQPAPRRPAWRLF